MPILDATSTVMAAPISIVNPLERENLEITELSYGIPFPNAFFTIPDSVLPRRCDFSQIFSHGFNDSASPNPKSKGNAGSSVNEQPDRGLSLRVNDPLLVDEPESNQRTNCVAMSQN
jgi:hypothetical protein